jgi:hypothetical protein
METTYTCPPYTLLTDCEKVRNEHSREGLERVAVKRLFILAVGVGPEWGGSGSSFGMSDFRPGAFWSDQKKKFKQIKTPL